MPEHPPRIATLDQLKAATLACRECPIGAFATQSVIGEGQLRPKLMLVGEQPGDQEDLQGRPFVGPAGKVLAHRGQWLPRADGRQVLVTLHPSALLRVDAEDREAAFEAFVADLRQAQRLFGR